MEGKSGAARVGGISFSDVVLLGSSAAVFGGAFALTLSLSKPTSRYMAFGNYEPQEGMEPIPRFEKWDGYSDFRGYLNIIRWLDRSTECYGVSGSGCRSSLEREELLKNAVEHSPGLVMPFRLFENGIFTYATPGGGRPTTRGMVFEKGDVGVARDILKNAVLVDYTAPYLCGVYANDGGYMYTGVQGRWRDRQSKAAEFWRF